MRDVPFTKAGKREGLLSIGVRSVVFKQRTSYKKQLDSCLSTTARGRTAPLRLTPALSAEAARPEEPAAIGIAENRFPLKERPESRVLRD